MECARPLAGGARVALDGVDEVVIGRGRARAIERSAAERRVRVSLPDRRMSADHARIMLGPSGASLEDLGSTNGTLVDGVAAAERVELRSGSVVEIGRTLFVYVELRERKALRAADLDGEQAAGALPGMATLDPVLADRLDRLKRIASSPVAVMLLGETGTGKEITARAVHALSKRPGPFVAINCGAIPATLVESQLFGHVKGAFSGAVRDEPGLVRSAQFGTLFLDEVGDLPAASQATLLRVLQEGEVLPVGATRATKVDIRVVCATHKPIDELTAHGDFRRDLYARLAGFAHTLPPLRERRVDLGLLVAALLGSPRVKEGERLTFRPEAARAMLRYDWPLNVRELEQCLSTASVLAEEATIRLEDLPPAIAELSGAPSSASQPAAGPERDEVLRRELLMRLAEARGSVSEVARAMGKARQQVQRWVRRFGIDADAFRDQPADRRRPPRDV
jgi:transcriptional regulator with PAS, ATPase and Fis domain